MKIFKLRAEEKIYQILELPVKYRIIALATVSPWSGIVHAYMGPHIFRKCFFRVIFSFILHPLILRKSMCYGSRGGPLPNNTSCHLIAKLRKVIIILGGPPGDRPVARPASPPLVVDSLGFYTIVSFRECQI